MEETILKHHKESKLFATKVNPTDPDVPLELDTNQPVFTWDKWIDKTKPLGEQGADVSGECVYHPTSLDQTNHGGSIKQHILDHQRQTKNPFAGWEVELQEPNPKIPREGKGQTKGKRKQLEANQKPEQYQQTIQTNPAYQNEHGLISESWITQFLTYLEKTNQVIDDFQGNGSTCYLSGSFHPASGRLGGGYWGRDSRRARLLGHVPGYRNSSNGFRSAVGIGKN